MGPLVLHARHLSLITAPLFALLSFCIAISTLGAIIQGLALMRAAHAVFAILGIFIVLGFGWWLLIMPPAL